MARKPNDATVQAWTQLVRASQVVMAEVERELKAAGFPPLAWYDVLLELGRAQDPPLRPFEVEQRLLLAQYNLSRLIDRLAQAGLVKKQPCADDGRGHVLRITAKGRALLDKMWPVYRAAIERHVGRRLSQPQASQLTVLLGRLMPDKAPVD